MWLIEFKFNIILTGLCNKKYGLPLILSDGKLYLLHLAGPHPFHYHSPIPFRRDGRGQMELARDGRAEGKFLNHFFNSESGLSLTELYQSIANIQWAIGGRLWTCANAGKLPVFEVMRATEAMGGTGPGNAGAGTGHRGQDRGWRPTAPSPPVRLTHFYNTRPPISLNPTPTPTPSLPNHALSPIHVQTKHMLGKNQALKLRYWGIENEKQFLLPILVTHTLVHSALTLPCVHCTMYCTPVTSQYPTFNIKRTFVIHPSRSCIDPGSYAG